MEVEEGNGGEGDGRGEAVEELSSFFLLRKRVSQDSFFFVLISERFDNLNFKMMMK